MLGCHQNDLQAASVLFVQLIDVSERIGCVYVSRSHNAEPTVAAARPIASDSIAATAAAARPHSRRRQHRGRTALSVAADDTAMMADIGKKGPGNLGSAGGQVSTGNVLSHCLIATAKRHCMRSTSPTHHVNQQDARDASFGCRSLSLHETTTGCPINGRVERYGPSSAGGI